MSSPLEKPQIIAHVHKAVTYTLFDAKWMPCSAKFVCLGNLARGSGIMQIYELQHGEAKLIKEVSVHYKAQHTLTLYASAWLLTSGVPSGRFPAHPVPVTTQVFCISHVSMVTTR